MSRMSILEINKVSKNFGGLQALRNVDAKINRGERFGLIGPNGSGKTTLLNVITGALPCDGGKIIFDGKDITRLPGYKRTRLGITRTFQIPKPFTSMTVLDNVVIPLMYASPKETPIHDVHETALETLRLVDLDKKANLKPGELTQIEMRKLELARALAIKPKLLLLDEVCAGLTSAEIDDVLSILRRLNEEEGITIIMIEHIMRAVMTFCERIMVLNSGIKIAEGTPEEITNNAEVVKAYLGE